MGDVRGLRSAILSEMDSHSLERRQIGTRPRRRQTLGGHLA
jgi:hypothetical protein